MHPEQTEHEICMQQIWVSTAFRINCARGSIHTGNLEINSQRLANLSNESKPRCVITRDKAYINRPQYTSSPSTCHYLILIGSLRERCSISSLHDVGAKWITRKCCVLVVLVSTRVWLVRGGGGWCWVRSDVVCCKVGKRVWERGSEGGACLWFVRSVAKRSAKSWTVPDTISGIICIEFACRWPHNWGDLYYRESHRRWPLFRYRCFATRQPHLISTWSVIVAPELYMFAHGMWHVLLEMAPSISSLRQRNTPYTMNITHRLRWRVWVCFGGGALLARATVIGQQVIRQHSWKCV